MDDMNEKSDGLNNDDARDNALENNEINNDIEKERSQTNYETDSKADPQDSGKGEKEDRENSQGEQEGSFQEEGHYTQEDSAPEKAAPLNSEVKEETPKYSTSYDPPYYVPNFTVMQPGESASFQSGGANTAPKPQKKRRWLIPIVALSVVVALVLVGSVGIGLGYIVHNLFDRNYVINDAETSDNAAENFGDETVTIIKNDGSIEVDGQLGSTGFSGLNVSEITALVADSVVEINTSLTVDTFYGQYITGGAGSGVIIGEVKSSGAYYVITNHHVIEGADSITVRLRNGSSYDAAVIGSSELDDIALLRIVSKNGEKLTTATLGKSANLKVGDGVVAIGNPLGTLGGTVTDGIISALDREIMVENNVMVLLQTNAAINPGNSGGGLFNSAGELIGIVNAKQSDTGIEGLGFAIPIDRASDCIDDLLEYGYVKGHSSLGVKVQTVSLSSGFSSNTYVQVTKASSGSALKAGDIIYSVNGETVSSVATFNASVYQLNIGDEATVQVIEKNSIGQTVLVSKTVKVIEYNPNNFS